MFEYEYSYEEDVAAQREEAEAIGEARGKAQKQTEIATKMLKLGVPQDTIVNCTGLTQDQLQALKANL